MNNIIVPFSGSKNIDFYIKNNIDGFIIGIEGFSENFNYYIEETKLKENNYYNNYYLEDAILTLK